MLKLPQNLSSERLLLREADVDDAELLYANVCRHPQVAKFLTWSPHKSIQETCDTINRIQAANMTDQEQTWLIEIGAEPAGLFSCWRDATGIEYGFCLGPKFWHRGYMTETLQLVTKMVRQAFPEETIWATTDHENLSSIKCLTANRFRRIRTIPRHTVHPNIEPELRDSILFEMEM